MPRCSTCRRYAAAVSAKPPGVGNPACVSAARLAAFGPVSSGSVAAAAASGTTKSDIRSLHVIPIARQRIDHGDLLDREVGDDLDAVLLDDQHFLDAHAVTKALAVLRLERERHALLNLDRMIERPDARDHRRIVLREAEAVTPEIGGGLVFVFVAPGLHRRGPLHRDVAG